VRAGGAPLPGRARPHQGEPGREAETWFLRALEIARGQHARVLELRAACSLYRLKKSQGDGERALGELCEAYRGFSEGLETTELTTARRLMGGE
jgi:hypothetical protein